MQTAIKTSIEQRPGPSPAAFSTLMRRIDQEKQATQGHTIESTTTTWWESVETALRSLFEIQWVPALASVLIIGQAFLLLSLGSPEGDRIQGSGDIVTRGIPQGTPQGSLLKITVGFQADAQEQHIREFLQTMKATIIDGPSSEGTYTLAIVSQNTVASEALLGELRQNAQLIRLAEPHLP